MSITFPVLNSSTLIIDSKGYPTKEFVNYLSTLQEALNDRLSNNGFRPPEISNIVQAKIETNGPQIQRGFVKNNDINKYQLLMRINPTTYQYKNIMMEP